MNEKLQIIQEKLKAPKNQVNKFGGYNYRNCEDIFEAVKPLLAKAKLTLRTYDELVLIGDRYYVKATAVLSDGIETIENTAYAREEETKKGMDGSQITGASSSYARKYALNGLFLIDDVKDSDTTNTHDKKSKGKDNDFDLGEPAVTKLSEQARNAYCNNIWKYESKGVNMEILCDAYKVDDVQKMTDEQLKDCFTKLEKKYGKLD